MSEKGKRQQERNNHRKICVNHELKGEKNKVEQGAVEGKARNMIKQQEQRHKSEERTLLEQKFLVRRMGI